jgi:hypothetical protein
MAGYPFASFASASEQVDVNPPYFLVYEFDLGKYSSIGHGNVGLGPIDISGLANGDVLVGWVEDSTLCTTGTGKNKKTKPCNAYGNVISQTPLLPSAIGSITFSAPPASTPEPGTLLLLGTGLLAVGSAAQRRFRKK